MSDTLQAASLWLIPACPLLAAISIALFGKTLYRCGGHQGAVAALVVSCGLSLVQLGYVASAARHVPAERESQAMRGAVEPPAARAPAAAGYEWVSIGDFQVRTDVRVDALTAVMLSMVTFVSLLVTVYASGYMHGDPGYSRFFAELSLFVFSMCMLVMSRNFVLLFVFWEAVGLCSYLLIGFWFERPSASAAAVKAFVMNRIGDAAFLIGLLLIWRTFGSFDFDLVFAKAPSVDPQRVLEICLCLFVGACGKSAQFPLHLWLPDAMEGPTPVSALIHAATMVTAGVYLVARCTPLFVLAPFAQAVVATIGGITALLGALIGLTQTDLKRVLAYSTISQLGYMFLALGSAAADKTLAAAAVTAAVFHMFTHAFFKALLFLSSGNVMHAMGNVIDMRRFSGLRKVLPVTHVTFLCGAAALAGVPFLSGFWSKDEIFGLLVKGTHRGGYQELFQVLFAVALFTALLTAFYTFRAYFLTFFGPTCIPHEAYEHAHHAACDLNQGHSSADHSSAGYSPDGHLDIPAAASPAPGVPAQIHEGPAAMKWPLVVLAVFAVAVGLVVGPTEMFAGWIGQTPTLGHEGPPAGMDWALAGAGSLAALVGIGAAALFYARPTKIPQRIARAISPLYKLSLNKFYLDEVADVFVAFPVNAIAFLSLVGDQGIVDRLVDWAGAVPAAFGKVLRPIQNGLIQSYALVMLFGLAIFLAMIIQVWIP